MYELALQRLYVFGDSIMRGVVTDRRSGRYRKLPDSFFLNLVRKTQTTFQNYSRFGCTIEKGKEALKRLLIGEPNPSAAILEFGGNDCDFNWAEVSASPTISHQPNTPLPQFRAQYRSFIEQVRERGIEPILMTLPPICGRRYLDWICRAPDVSRENILIFIHDEQTIYRYQELYSNQALLLAKEMSCPVIDVRSRFLERRDCSSLIGPDGIHPNKKGHVLIRKTVREFFKKN